MFSSNIKTCFSYLSIQIIITHAQLSDNLSLVSNTTFLEKGLSGTCGSLSDFLKIRNGQDFTNLTAFPASNYRIKYKSKHDNLRNKNVTILKTRGWVYCNRVKRKLSIQNDITAYNRYKCLMKFNRRGRFICMNGIWQEDWRDPDNKWGIMVCPNYKNKGEWADQYSKQKILSHGYGDYCNNLILGPIKLINPRFHDGKYWDGGEYDLSPERAIDGVKFDDRTNWQVSHAHNSPSPPLPIVFMVDLQNNSKINKILIYPRWGCCHGRYVDMEVFVRDLSGIDVKCEHVDNVKIDTAYIKSKLKTGVEFHCFGIISTMISVTNPKQHLQIVEIEAS